MRAPRTFRAAVAAASALATLALAAGPADAHSAKLFNLRYPTDPNYWNVTVNFDGSVPGGKTRSRVQDGAKQWTRLGRQLVFNVHRKGINGKGIHHCQSTSAGYSRGVVYWKSIDGHPASGGDILGLTYQCYWTSGTYKGKMAGFTMEFDSKQGQWYRGTGNVPSGSIDLWSVASHEFGHASGWNRNHYKTDNNASICASSNKGMETMCPYAYPGQSRQRTLGRHDKHTFKRVYAPR
jgi:hypothetical protein